MLRALWMITSALLCLTGTAFAHHSFTMYDPAQLIHIRGTVKTFQWTNPHVMMWVVKESEPAGELWTIELPTSPGNMARMGWSKHSLKPGDKVDVEVSPLRDGQHGGSFKKITLVDSGQVLVATAPPVEANDAGAETKPQAVDCSETQEEAAQHAAEAKGAELKVAQAGGGCACTLSEPRGEADASALAALGLCGLLLLRRLRRQV